MLASRRRSAVYRAESCELYPDHGGGQTVACVGAARCHAASVWQKKWQNRRGAFCNPASLLT